MGLQLTYAASGKIPQSDMLMSVILVFCWANFTHSVETDRWNCLPCVGLLVFWRPLQEAAKTFFVTGPRRWGTLSTARGPDSGDVWVDPAVGLGIKPLYWAKTSGAFLFGSELKALRPHPECPGEINRAAVAGFLRHNYIGGTNSIYRDINKLEPGWMLPVRAGEDPELEQFWSFDAVVAQAQANPFTGSDDEAVAALHDLLLDATGRRMVADVPLGAFLSGGIDSSTVVALMQAQSNRPIRTFSIGFHEEGYNEANHAAAVAKNLGTAHTEL